MKELTGQIQEMISEVDDLDHKIRESRHGLREQVSSILSVPPPRVLYQNQRPGTEPGGALSLPPGRSTLQAPRKGGGGHERKTSGDRSTLQAPQRKGHERKASGDRSALLAPQRKGHERKGSGDRRSRGGERRVEDRKGFTSTL